MSRPSGTKSQRVTSKHVPSGIRAVQQFQDRKAQSEAAKALVRTKAAPIPDSAESAKK